MKKLLLVLAIGATFAACNNSGGEKPATDSTAAAASADTSKPAVVDTMKHDSAAMAPAKADTTKK